MYLSEREVSFTGWWWRKDSIEAHYSFSDMESWYYFGSLNLFPPALRRKLVLSLNCCCCWKLNRDPCLSSWELPQFHFVWLCCSGRDSFVPHSLTFITLSLFGFLTFYSLSCWQSLLAALGSIQFVSNIAFAYVVLNKMVTVKCVTTTFNNTNLLYLSLSLF